MNKNENQTSNNFQLKSEIIKDDLTLTQLLENEINKKSKNYITEESTLLQRKRFSSDYQESK